MAHSNLGMIYDKIGEGDKAQLNHQLALKYAI